MDNESVMCRAELKRKAREIAAELETQDARGQAEPMVCIEQMRKIFGVDPSDGTPTVLDEYGNEPPDPEVCDLLQEHKRTGKLPEGYTLTYFDVTWDHVSSFFTDAAAERYLDDHLHELSEPKIRFNDGAANEEWRAVREILVGLFGRGEHQDQGRRGV